ncbi:MAG: PEP-utilizing enzyme, partial [Planctomycetota bacterium]
ERVRTYAWWREEIRNLSTYVYYLVRAWTLDAARRLIARGVLQTTDDTFMLRQEELLAALTQDLEVEAVREKVAAGHHLLRSFRNFEIPDEIGPRYSGGAAPMSPAELAALAEGSLVGLACSPGRVEGTAKVCLSLEDTQKVQPGDILVTRFTDPGWTPLFAMIAGVVTETGGLLAHAAVISREYGIPAVLALKGATKAIRDGDQIVVDGSRGVVELNSAS